MNKGTKVAVVAVVVVIAAVAGYLLFPYAVSTKISDLKNNQVAYIYGTVEERNAFGNSSIFVVNDTSGNVYVIWNGTLPAIGDKALVHGTYKEGTVLFLKYSVFEATSVTVWPT